MQNSASLPLTCAALLMVAASGCPSDDSEPQGSTDSATSGDATTSGGTDDPTSPTASQGSATGTSSDPSTTTPPTSGSTSGSETTDASAGSSTGEPDGPPAECVAMVEAADAFLNGLDQTQVDTATFEWADATRTQFEFLPPNSAPRDGLSMRDMDEGQKTALLELLGAVLSVQGFDKEEGIRELESVLAMQEDGVPVTDNRDPENYFVSIFGTLSVDSEEPWGLRFEGHHMSLHASAIACSFYAATPGFWGVSGGTAPLDTEITLSQQLWDALDGDQQAQADVGVGADAVDQKTGQIDPFAAVGLPAGDMTADQQDLLRDLIDQYVGNMNEPIAQSRWDAIEAAGFDDVYFAWSSDSGNFRILGPSFVIEFVWASQGHVHSVWRDYDGDYGEDLIEQHMQQHPHPHPHAHGHLAP